MACFFPDVAVVFSGDVEAPKNEDSECAKTLPRECCVWGGIRIRRGHGKAKSVEKAHLDDAEEVEEPE